jgi:hypothetical protein
MKSFNKVLAYGLVFLGLAVVFIGIANATTMNFIVPSGGTVGRSFELASEDRVLIQFAVVGGTSNTLQFSMVFPNGTTEDFGESGDFSYSFVSDAQGECTLHFTNNDSTAERTLTLNYSIDHYVFGMSQNLFMTIFITLVCVVLVASFVLLSKHSYLSAS